jgi:hypothetical protein
MIDHVEQCVACREISGRSEIKTASVGSSLQHSFTGDSRAGWSHDFIRRCHAD